MSVYDDYSDDSMYQTVWFGSNSSSICSSNFFGLELVMFEQFEGFFRGSVRTNLVRVIHYLRKITIRIE